MPVENAPDEILEMTKKMLDRLGGRYARKRGRALQWRFMALIRQGDYGYGAGSRIDAAFLRRYSPQPGG